MAEVSVRCVRSSPGDLDAVQTMLESLATTMPTIAADTTPGTLRRHLAQRRSQPFLPAEPGLSIVNGQVRRADGSRLRVRDYLPESGDSDRWIVYVHGGGWVLGSADHFDAQCVRLARVAGCGVRSVDYRLAPEHPYPAALDDVLLALRDLRAQPAAIIGESAGGALAFGACLVQRDNGERQPGALAVWYPLVEPPQSGPPAPATGLDSALLRLSDLDWFWRQYVGRAATIPYALPSLHPSLVGLAPTALVIAGQDPTAPAARRLSDRLVKDDVPLLLVECPGLPHAFTALPLAAAGTVTTLVSAWVDGHQLHSTSTSI